MNKIIALLCLALLAVSIVSAQSEIDSENQCPEDHNGTEHSPSSIDVYFEVPEFIEEGLSDGSMERVGGVIRYSDDGQVVAWLRQGGQMGQVAESAAGLLEHITRHSRTEHLALGRLLAGFTPLLNISMAGFSLIEHIVGIRAHEAELERIYDRVSEEFQRDREVELFAALDYAENTFLVKSDAFKHEAVARAAYELAVARSQLNRDLDELLMAEMNPENSNLAMSYQILSMKVCAMSVRLRLEIGEDEAATNWLSQCVGEHKIHARSFVSKWLGNQPALFFHESVSDEYFERYLNIERWLRGKRDVLPEIVKAYRSSFWDKDAIAALYSGGLNSQLIELPFYDSALTNAEILIENYQRLEGFEHELESMCLPTFEQWDTFDGENGVSISKHDGYALLIKKPLPGGESEASH